MLVFFKLLRMLHCTWFSKLLLYIIRIKCSSDVYTCRMFQFKMLSLLGVLCNLFLFLPPSLLPLSFSLSFFCSLSLSLSLFLSLSFAPYPSPSPPFFFQVVTTWHSSLNRARSTLWAVQNKDSWAVSLNVSAFGAAGKAFITFYIQTLSAVATRKVSKTRNLPTCSVEHLTRLP